MPRVLFLIAAALLIAGCSSTPSSNDPPAPAEVASPTEEPSPVLPFGAAHTWPNGDVVTVASPELREADGRTYAVVDVTVTNAGPEPANVNSYVVRGVVDGVEEAPHALADMDTAAGFLAPGDSRTFQAAYAAPPGSELQIQVFGEMFDPLRPVVFFEGPVS